MKETIKKKWLKALRGGEFKQGQSSLVYGNKYCCLGVLRYINNPHDSSCRIRAAFLNDRQLAEFGLSDDEQLTAAKMNDKGNSFLKIADWIEEAL